MLFLKNLSMWSNLETTKYLILYINYLEHFII